jgi:hypothetical protein
MAYLGEAFNILKFNKNTIYNIDYFFTQRTVIEEVEYIDKNMNRKNKKNKVIHNFLALNIPIINNWNKDKNNIEIYNKNFGFNIEIFGDEGYHYKGYITSYDGIIPNFMIPINGDKKIFVNINYNNNDNNTNHENNESSENTNKTFISFIDVPKRYQNIDDTINKLE